MNTGRYDDKVVGIDIDSKQVAITHSYSNSEDGLSNYITDDGPIFVTEDFYFTMTEVFDSSLNFLIRSIDSSSHSH